MMVRCIGYARPGSLDRKEAEGAPCVAGLQQARLHTEHAMQLGPQLVQRYPAHAPCIARALCPRLQPAPSTLPYGHRGVSRILKQVACVCTGLLESIWPVRGLKNVIVWDPGLSEGSRLHRDSRFSLAPAPHNSKC